MTRTVNDRYGLSKLFRSKNVSIMRSLFSTKGLVSWSENVGQNIIFILFTVSAMKLVSRGVTVLLTNLSGQILLSFEYL